MSTTLYGILVILSLGFAKAANSVIGGEVYLKQITNRMLDLLSTETSISGDGLPIVDMVGNFSKLNSFGLKLDGLVKFHSGFVMKIETTELNPIKYEDKTDDTKAFIQNIMSFLNVNMTFELDCDLDEFKERASMVVWIQGLDFYVSVSRNHATGIVEPSVTFYNIAGGVNKIHIYNFPNNGYTQLIAKEIKTAASKTGLLNQLKASFNSWKNLQKYLDQACKEIPFPEICSTCL